MYKSFRALSESLSALNCEAILDGEIVVLDGTGRPQFYELLRDAQSLVMAQNYQDAAQALDRLRKRVFYLQQARQIGIQQMPQIRICQNGPSCSGVCTASRTCP